MPQRKDHIAIVLDTNVLIANYLSFNPSSASATIVRLWRNEMRLQRHNMSGNTTQMRGISTHYEHFGGVIIIKGKSGDLPAVVWVGEK